jgi:hypothetical protein
MRPLTYTWTRRVSNLRPLACEASRGGSCWRVESRMGIEVSPFSAVSGSSSKLSLFAVDSGRYWQGCHFIIRPVHPFPALGVPLSTGAPGEYGIEEGGGAGKGGGEVALDVDGVGQALVGVCPDGRGRREAGG